MYSGSMFFSEHFLPLSKQVGNPTSTTSHLKRRETKDAQGYDHVQAYLGICQKKIYVKKLYVKT
jgi:hypothetical protein